ncbi:MAG: FliI/YscN family ATPase [Pseudomonadota bacterium]
MKNLQNLDLISAVIARHPVIRRIGRITNLSSNTVLVSGLSDIASIGDRVSIGCDDTNVEGEIIEVARDDTRILMDGGSSGLRIGLAVRLEKAVGICPDDSWLGRIVNGNGVPLDGRPIVEGECMMPLYSNPPPATSRRALGPRLHTGFSLFNTILPIVRGQRMGVFSGSGVGKSSLMAAFAREMDADVIVIALIGERGREVNQFVERVLGKKGLARSIVVASTSDESAITRRRAAFSAMAIAEYFRDKGLHVLLMLDSITRLAEAHREIASAAGESLSMRGFPPSMVNLLAGFAERAGPGADGQSDISAIFTVLVSGSDMEEPVADTLRGLLDGHIVLSRAIAEKGRFPAVDVLQSVSRSLPDAASDAENALITRARKTLGTFEESEIMVRSGLYQAGTNPELDLAVQQQPKLDEFAAETTDSVEMSFKALEACFAGNSE